MCDFRLHEFSGHTFRGIDILSGRHVPARKFPRTMVGKGAGDGLGGRLPCMGRECPENKSAGGQETCCIAPHSQAMGNGQDAECRIYKFSSVVCVAHHTLQLVNGGIEVGARRLPVLPPSRASWCRVLAKSPAAVSSIYALGCSSSRSVRGGRGRAALDTVGGDLFLTVAPPS